MGFLDKLLGRKKADEPQTATAPAATPAADTAVEPDSHEGHDHDHDREGQEH